jgi:hypothetical protein
VTTIGPRHKVPASTLSTTPRRSATEPDRCGVSLSILTTQQQAATMRGGLFHFLDALRDRPVSAGRVFLSALSFPGC